MIQRKTPLKRGQKPLKRTPIRKKRKVIDPQVREKDLAFYEQCWKEKPHFCFETGAFLGSEPKTYMFHHVLEKSKYPQFRHEIWNIVLVSWETHDQAHSNIDKTPKIKYYRDFLLRTYG